ncbi:nucleotidyltransferase domain-containing protein [Phytohabitans flavus]|uniref:nucleotidyltransferase domain-containing protein n=1 Tax=Phytohabitans flavus TaxID=1076124 RepID=UPI00363A41F7
MFDSPSQPVSYVRDLLDGFGPPWFLCGGWAADSWLGRQSRDHADVDIGVFHDDQKAIFEHFEGGRSSLTIPTSPTTQKSHGTVGASTRPRTSTSPRAPATCRPCRTRPTRRTSSSFCSPRVPVTGSSGRRRTSPYRETARSAPHLGACRRPPRR